MSRSRIAALAAATTLLVTGGLAANAGAAFHEIKVSEVHTEAGATNDYFEFQMYSAGQNLLTGHHVRLFNAAGTVNGDYPVPSIVPNGQSQRTFTVGNTALRDFNYGGAVVDPAGGAVCWNEGNLGAGGFDCVSWGSYAPGVEALSSPAGTNAAAIPEGQSIHRKITPGCATLLEAGDDTNNSAADFVVGAPTPRNNSVAPTEKPCSSAKKKKKKCKKKKKKGKGKYGAAEAKKKKCKKKKKK